MQYKIPIQIENEDTIVAGLSLRQLGIIIVGVILAFGIFNKFESVMPRTPLIVICIVIIFVFFVVAKFRTHEMTFLPFVLNFARFRINGNGANGEGRIWVRGADGYSTLELGYIASDSYVEPQKKHEKKTENLLENIKKI